VVRMPAAQVVDDSVVVLQDWTNQKRHDVRLRERKGMVQERGRGEDSMHWNQRDLATALRSSGEEFAQPGGAIGSGTGGELERRGRAFIGAGESDETGGH
jgi:hypothetical protein